MAKSIVGYTNDISSEKVVYTGEKVEASLEDNLLEANTIIDNDPESETYREVRVYVKAPDVDRELQSDWNQDDNEQSDFIKNKPFKTVGDGLYVSNKILKINKDIVESPDRLDDHDLVIADLENRLVTEEATSKDHDEKIESLQEEKQEKLISGQNIKTINGLSLLGEGNIVIEDLLHDYERLENKPIINGVELNGSLSLHDLGIDIPAKTSELENDSDFVTSNYHDDTKQDALESGVNIKTINGNNILGKGDVLIEAANNYNLAINKPLINGVELKGDKSLLELDIQRKLIAGKNIKISDNEISAVCSGEIGRTFTTNITVGHLDSGTKILETDSIGDILYKMLYREKPKTVDIYYGGSSDLPSDISKLTRLTVTKDELLDNYDITIYCGDLDREPGDRGQYPTFAVPDNYIVSKWSITEMPSLSIDYSYVQQGGYNIYYIPTKSFDIDLGGIEYRITVEEN